MTAVKATEQINTHTGVRYATGIGFDFHSPDPKFVMTYDLNNQPLSYFESDWWDYAAYSPNASGNYKCWFKKDTASLDEFSQTLLLEHKLIVAAFQFNIFSPFQETPSASQIKNASRVLHKIRKICIDTKNKISSTLSNPLKLKPIIKQLTTHDQKTLKSLLMTLASANSSNFIAHFNIGETLPLFKFSKKENFQHPVIPSRILFEKLLSYQEVLDDYFKFEKEIAQVNSLSLLCHSYLTEQTYDYDVPSGVKKSGRGFQKIIFEFGLFDLAKKYNIISPINLSNFLGKVQYCSMMLIVAYTGMRRSEALSLKYDCMSIKKRKYGRIRHIIGITTKLTKTRFETSWVTCSQVVPALKAAQSVCKLIANSLYISDENLNSFPLFISRAYLTLSVVNSRTGKRDIGDYKVGALQPRKFEESMRQVLITQEDLEELTEVAPFQDWNLDGLYSIGENWPITVHQLRRSLAVYAAKSGLVRHSSLRRQLKHLSVEMSLYYARGSSRVRSIFNPSPDHIIHEFSKEKLAELDSILYIRDVLMRYEDVHGGHAEVLKTQGLYAGTAITLSDKKKTMDDFKKGKKAWRPTFLGGCTSIDGCKTVAHPTLTKCIVGSGCNEAAILPEKVDTAISMQNKLISVLDVTSIEYRSEVAQLEDLMRIKEEISE